MDYATITVRTEADKVGIVTLNRPKQLNALNDQLMDELGQALLWKHIHSWQQQGRTQIVVCHDLAAVRQHIPQTLLIKASGCLFGSSEELIVQPIQMQVA